MNPRAERLHNCACIADQNGHRDAAIAMWRRSLFIEPDCVPAITGLALALFAAGEQEEAGRWADKALALGGHAWAWTLKGRLETIAGRLDVARECFDEALAMEPSSPERLFDAAAAALRAGDYDEGLPLHTAANRALALPVPPIPRWDGKAVDRLLVLARLGFGDNIMFSRFIPWAQKRARKVTVLALPSQVPLYGAYAARGVDVVTECDISKQDTHIEVYALAELAGCALDDVPPPAPTRPRVVRDHLRVGIVWSGSDDTATNEIRRVPFEVMLRLAANPTFHLHSFQTGDRSADIAKAHAQVLVKDLSAQIEWDWSLTARMLDEVDILVAPDCGVAHLAAAMGIPTCVMLSAYADWRWGTGPTTPWYPSARLFRQSRVGDWDPVIAAVDAELASWPLPALCDTAYGRMYLLPHDVPRGFQIASTGKAPDHDDIEELCGIVSERRNGRPPVVLDVGANFGCFSLALARTGAKVYAFEPQQLFADFLRASAKLNGHDITVFDSAAGSEYGFAMVPDVDYMQAVDYGMIKLGREGRPVAVNAIDNLISGPVDLIKIDVEGMEADVLAGARRTISESRPTIFLEWSLSDPEALRGMLDDLGYAIVREGERDWLCAPR